MIEPLANAIGIAVVASLSSSAPSSKRAVRSDVSSNSRAAVSISNEANSNDTDGISSKVVVVVESVAVVAVVVGQLQRTGQLLATAAPNIELVQSFATKTPQVAGSSTNFSLHNKAAVELVIVGICVLAVKLVSVPEVVDSVVLVLAVVVVSVVADTVVIWTVVVVVLDEAVDVLELLLVVAQSS